jgi:heat shock protein HslJ
MKLTTYISASVFIFMSAVVIRQNESRHQASSLYETKWELRQIHANHETVDVNNRAFIRFDEEKQSAGGNGGCNSFGSSVKTDGNNIRFSEIFSTKMYCEGVQELENDYLSNLSNVTRYEIRGGVLSLFNNKEILLQFVAEAD